MKLRTLGNGATFAAVTSIAVAAALIALAGCSKTVATPIGFAQDSLTIDGYTFVEGQKIVAVTLPEAMDSSGELTYSLMPSVPGLTLHATTRVLSGTPTAAGAYPVTYEAKTAGGQTIALKLTITVVNSLRGTWQITYDWWEDDQIVGTMTETLTFTTSRYVLSRAHYYTDGTLSHVWSPSGTWRSTDTTVTRIREEDHDDDDDTPPVETTAETMYHWGDEARSKLLMPPWDWFGEDDGDDEYTLYERIEDPLPSIVGTWMETDVDNVDRHRLVEINADGTFVYRDHVPGEWSWKLSANWTEDRSEMFVLLTNPVLQFTRTIDGVEVAQPIDRWSWISSDDKLRMAYAPTHSPSEMVVSNFGNEPGWNDSDTVDRKYGDYWLTLARQP